MIDKNHDKILITGATGFIGSHLARELSSKEYQVICLVLPGDDSKSLAGLNVKVVYGDITDKYSLVPAIDGIEVIYHLAAVITGNDSDSYYRVNFEGTKNLIRICTEKRLNLKRFLFVSTIAAFGPTGESMINENYPANPIDDYGRSKLMAEQYLKSEDNPFPFTIIRFVNIYGPGQLDSLYHICKIASKGFQFNTGIGEIMLGYVDDVVDGIIQACESPNTVGETYFLGENKFYRLSEVISIFSRAVRQKLIKISLPYPLLYFIARSAELFAAVTRKSPLITREQVACYLKQCHWKFDIRKAARDFNFHTRISLTEGAKKTVAWYKESGYL